MHLRHWELLAIKVALEEWWHWLEGARHLFIVFTDHRNLEYIKLENSGQARWVLFFTLFDLQISYRPSSKNGTVDSHSRCFAAPEPEEDPQAILLAYIIADRMVPGRGNCLGNAISTSASAVLRILLTCLSHFAGRSLNGRTRFLPLAIWAGPIRHRQSHIITGGQRWPQTLRGQCSQCQYVLQRKALDNHLPENYCPSR